MVIMLISGLFMDDKIAYSVVVLPLPVGPVIRIIPFGDLTRFFRRSRRSGSRPIRGSLRMNLIY